MNLALAGLFLASTVRAAPVAPVKDPDRVVAIVNGFEITARAANSDYYLYQAMEKIADGQAALKTIGVDASPEAVAAWRDARIAKGAARADAFRRYLAKPADARRIYEESGDSAWTFEQWSAQAAGFKDEAAIARWQAGSAGLRWSLSPERKRSWPTWQLLADMCAERGLGPMTLAPDLGRIFDARDLRMLAELSREQSEGYIDVSPYANRVTAVENVKMESTTTIAGMMASSALAGYFAGDLAKIESRERLQALKLIIRDPAYERARMYLKPNPQYERSRAELFRPVTLDEAPSMLKYRDGRGTMAYLALARAGRNSEEFLLDAVAKVSPKFSGREGDDLAGALLVLRWLRSEKGLAEIEARKLWEFPWETAADQSLATLAAMKPALLPVLLEEAVRKWEAEKLFPPIGAGYVPSDVRARMIYYARASPDEARRGLKKYLKSPRIGVAVAAARILAQLGDDAGFDVAKRSLEQSADSTDVEDAVSVFRFLNQSRAVAVLDAVAKKRSDPRLESIAREIEFRSMPPKKKWETALAWALDEDAGVRRKGMERLLEGAIAREEGALAALRDLSQRKGGRNQQEAADTLAFVAKLPLKP